MESQAYTLQIWTLWMHPLVFVLDGMKERERAKCLEKIEWNVSWSQFQAGCCRKGFVMIKSGPLGARPWFDGWLNLAGHKGVGGGRRCLQAHPIALAGVFWAGVVDGRFKGALSCYLVAMGQHWGCWVWADMLILIHWGIIIDDQPCCHIWESLVRPIISP